MTYAVYFLSSQACIRGYLIQQYQSKLESLSLFLLQIKSFAELPVLFDEQFCKDHNCEDCGDQLNIDLFLSNTPHFFTIGKVACLK
jgi:hypothetical protein